MPTFTEQIAVVTGAGSGIGKSIAIDLAAQGATLCLVGRKVEALKLAIDPDNTHAQRLWYFQTDLSRDKDIQELAGLIRDKYQRVDMLIHSAGVISHGRIGAASVDDFDRQYRINVRAPYLLTQVLLPLLKARQGQIVFINSSLGLRSQANVGQYAATKHALKAVADTLREEVNADGVRVLTVYLGRTASPMQAAIHEMEGKPYRPERLLQAEDVAAVILNALTLPRTAEVTDVHIRPFMKPS